MTAGPRHGCRTPGKASSEVWVGSVPCGGDGAGLSAAWGLLRLGCRLCEVVSLWGTGCGKGLTSEG